MKLNDIIMYNAKKIKSNTLKKIIAFLLMIICVVIMLSAITIKKSMNSYINNNFKYNINFRTLELLNPDEIDDIKKMENFDHVVVVYKMSEYIASVTFDDYKNDNLDGDVKLIAYSNKLMPDIIKGKMVENDNDIICPINIITDSSVGAREDLSKNDYINLEKKIGAKIGITYYNIKNKTAYADELIIKGLYDPSIYVLDKNTCFASNKKIEEININRNSYIDSKELMFLPRIIIDNYDNVKIVKDNLIKDGYIVNEMSNFDISLINLINIGGSIIIIISLLGLFIIIILSTLKSIKNNKEELVILKILGFKEKDIFRIKYNEMFLKISLSMLIGLIIYLILYEYIYSLINETIALNFKLEFAYEFIIYYILIIVFIFIFVYKKIYKIIREIRDI